MSQLKILTLATLLMLASSGAQRSHEASREARADSTSTHQSTLPSSGDAAAQRAHVWSLWASLTERGGVGDDVEDGVEDGVGNSVGLAGWESWYRADEIFTPNPSVCQGEAEAPRAPERQFESLVQLEGTPEDIGESNLTFVMYNEAACRHIIENGYHLRSTLDGLLAADTADIAPFPKESMIVKTFWVPVNGQELSPLPVWDDSSDATDGATNSLPTWERIVLIDATGERVGETVAHYTLPDGSRSYQNVKVVGLNDFYHTPFDEATVHYLRRTIASSKSARVVFHSGVAYPLTPTTFFLGRDPQTGDYAALVALHLTTKETPEWLWATFWWHDEAQKSPYGADVAGVRPPFSHYKMDVAFDMVTPLEADGSPNAVYNPYMELGLPGGAASNCMSCHARATHTASADSLLFSTRRDVANAVSSLNRGKLPAVLGDGIRERAFAVADDALVKETESGWEITNGVEPQFVIERAEDGATLRVKSTAFTPLTVGNIDPTSAYYDDRLRSDFLWSIPVRAVPDAAGAGRE